MSVSYLSWSWMIFSGVSWNLRLSDSRLKLMPLSVMVPYLLFSLIMEKAWKPPESVMMGFCQAAI